MLEAVNLVAQSCLMFTQDIAGIEGLSILSSHACIAMRVDIVVHQGGMRTWATEEVRSRDWRLEAWCGGE